MYNARESDPKTIPKQKLAQKIEAENNLSRLHTREVGQRNIINYDQVYDPRSTHTTVGPFQPAKNVADIAAANEIDPVLPGPAPTAVSVDRLNQFLDHNGETQHYIRPEDVKTVAVDEETERRIEQIVSLDHRGNVIQRVSEAN